MLRVPPKNTHHVLGADAPQSPCPANSKRHELIGVILAYGHQPPLGYIVQAVARDGMTPRAQNLIPVHFFELGQTLENHPDVI